MNRRSFLSAAMAAPALAGQTHDDYTPLFDGRTLRGWVVEEGPESSFYVEDGAIVIHPSASSPT
jgi:hypothetical protein